MKVWKLEIDFGDYESYQLNSTDKKLFVEVKNKLLSGKTQKNILDYTEVSIVDGIEKSDISKFWGASGTIIFNKKAKVCLEELVKTSVEFIPLKCDSREIYLVNILDIVDGIDSEKSVFKELDTGLVVGIETYIFKIEQLINKNMFKVTLNNRIFNTEIFVSSAFKELVDKNKLVGLKFTEVWDSDN